MYLPAFPAMATDLHTPVSSIQLSLTSYFIGISVGQLFYGPLLDRYGRRVPLFVGLIGYIIASVACAMSNSIHLLIAMRLLQALGGCVGLVASRALVRDLFPVSETAKIFSLLLLVLAVSPLLAPTVGGYVTVAFGWHSIFIILAVICLIILVTSYYFLPEGRQADVSISLKPKAIISNFIIVFKQPQFFTYALCGSLASAVVYAYIAGSPDVFLDIYKVDPRHYGWIFAFVAVGIIGSSQLNTLLLRWFTSKKLILAGLCWQILIGSLLIMGTYFDWYNVIGVIIMIFLIMCGQGFTIPNSSALAINPFSRLTGTASALLGALQLAMGALASAIVSFTNNNTEFPMLLVMVGCVCASLVLYALGRMRSKRHEEAGNYTASSTTLL